MVFEKYPKIMALHKEECDGILDGTCYIQEKVDGANASIWNEDGEIHYGSRSRDLFKASDNFNGFGTWIEQHAGVKKLLIDHPEYRLNGEWLVRHTIGYNELAYRKFYLFDITIEEGETKITMPMDEMYRLAEEYDIPAVHLFAVLENPTLEQIIQHCGTSVLGSKGEGVVIKNLAFINKFGDKQFGKFVTQEFKEDNAVTFGGNNRTSDTYEETYFMNQMMTLARVQKIFHKAESQHGRLDMKNIPMIMGMCYHDLITEEGWVIAQEMGKNKKKFDYHAFKMLCDKKAKSIFIEILTGDVSVAHSYQKLEENV